MLGRRPLLISANNVNCETIRAAPPTSTRLRFILPASSANTRRSMILSASRRTVLESSSPAAPTNNTRPRPMVARCSAPAASQLTAPSVRRRGLRAGAVRCPQHHHAAGHAPPERPAPPPYPDHRSDDRNPDAEPFHDRVRDRRRDAALLRARSGIRPRRVDQRDDRKPELRGVMGKPQRFAVALGVHHPPVPGHALFHAAALLVAEEQSGAVMPCAVAPKQRRIVSRQPIAVQLDEGGRQAADIVEGVRALRVTGLLDDLPHAHEYISSRSAS